MHYRPKCGMIELKVQSNVAKRYLPQRLALYLMAVVTTVSVLLPASAGASSLQYRLDNDMQYVNPDAVTCTDEPSGIVIIDSSEASEAIFKYLISSPLSSNNGRPLTALQAAAFMGNFYQESRYNPAIIQSGRAYDEARAMNRGVGGYGFGLVQWDGTRRVDLLEYAKQQGKDWRDISLQLAFITHELEGKEQSIIKDTAFRTTTNIETATLRVRVLYERPGAPHDANRYAAARAALKRHGHLAPDISLSMSMSDTGNETSVDCSQGITVGNGSVAETARAFSWPKSVWDGATDHGILEANKSYAAAIKKVGIDKCGHPMQKIGASCDAFVATVLRFTKVDEKFPCGGSYNQDRYMARNTQTFSKVGTFGRGQEKTAMAAMQPGDILARDGHVSIYLGDGREADASIGRRTAEQFSFLLDGTYNVYRAKVLEGPSSL